MEYKEFNNGHHFDPYIHSDYEFVHSMISHFTRMAESPLNPLLTQTRERTAATHTTFPIINNLFMQFQDIIQLKWIEVLHSDTSNSKIDGLALKKEDGSMLAILELAGGTRTSTLKKLNADVYESYKNALKTLRRNHQNKIFIVLYFDNTLFFESLKKYDHSFIRKRHLTLDMPKIAWEIKPFVASNTYSESVHKKIWSIV